MFLLMFFIFLIFFMLVYVECLIMGFFSNLKLPCPNPKQLSYNFDELERVTEEIESIVECGQN